MSLSYAAVKHAAAGRWRDTIFPRFGITVPVEKKHGACPVCGGTDRFRCDDKGGNGTFICNNCGAGDGFKLIQLYNNMTPADVLREVAAVVGLQANSTITDEQREHWKVQAEAKAQADKADKLKAQAAAKRRAQKLWADTQNSTTDCPYLIKKQVDNFGGKVNSKGVLLIPLRNKAFELVNIQTIDLTGTKVFLSGGEVTGCYHMIGAVQSDTQVLCVAEGYSTAASIHMATGYPVATAFNAGNLPPVGLVMRELYPVITLLYCADNDLLLERKTGKNTGILKAKEAAALTNGLVIWPDFEGFTHAD